MYNLQYNVMVPSNQSITVTPWYPGMLLRYGSVSHIRHAPPHLTAYAVIVLAKGMSWCPQP